MARITTICLVFSFCFATLRAETINVPSDFSLIQDAITASVNGDTILVAPGVYVENINFRGKNIVLASEFLFDRNPETIVATVINGGTPVHPDTGSCVIINSGEDSSAVLEGFTLTGGIGTRWIDEHGAGTYTEGGGILIQYSSPTIRHNRIVGNTAIRVVSGIISAGGGGIRIGDGTPEILNNVIMDNEGLYGGGIVLNYTGGTVRNNIIANNRVYQAAGNAPTFGGGGIWISSNFGSNQKVVENNTIYGNSVTGFGGRGGGILVGGTTVIVRNNIIWNNTQVTGGQIGGNPVVSFSDVQNGYPGEGNIDIDPLLSDTSFYLSPGSLCIDAGDSSGTMNDPEDPMNAGSALWPAAGELRNDMGAYGGPGSTQLGSFPITSVDDLGSDSPVPLTFSLLQNYPNPFNPSTTFEFQLAGTDVVTLVIFDMLGRPVGTLVNESLPAGTHRREWNAAGLPSGVYFARLMTGSAVETRRLMLLR